MITLHLTVDGTDTDAEALHEWLRSEPQLRGRIRRTTRPAPVETMGSLTDLVVEGLITGSLGATITVLAESLKTWLQQRHRKPTITITTSNGHQVTIDQDNAADIPQVLQTLTEAHTDESETLHNN